MSRTPRALGPRTLPLTVALVLCAIVGGTLLPAAEIGAKIEPFSLPDIHGRDRSLDELADKPIVVVAFLGVECPLARLYAPRLQELSDAYATKNVAIIGVDANQQDSLSDMSAFARQYEVKFPLLKDRDSSLADQFGVVRNPEVFVLDRERKIRYRGRIDDQYGQGSSSGYAKTEVKTRNLADALDELLAGKEVSQPSTPVMGCLIGRKPKAQPKGDVTYTRNIAGLLQDKCVACHRAGQIGPFALTDYEEVVGWGEMIKEVVSDGRMPPWSANPQFGHFANDARLSDAQKQLIFAWVDNGCPQGDPADLPKPRTWTDGWQIAEPQQVVYMDEPFTVPAEGVVDYQNFVVDPGWTEDKWIQAAEVRPGNRAVVHHIIASAIPPGVKPRTRRTSADAPPADRTAQATPQSAEGRASRAVDDGELRSIKLTAYVPGRLATTYKSGIAMFVPAGSKIVFQMHYTPNGKQQLDKSFIGFVFADPQTVKKRVHGGRAGNSSFVIPPHADNHEVLSEVTLRKDHLMLWMSPHMHLRGKSFRYEAFYPDGTSEILLDVPRYDFNWQITYELAEAKRLPAGTKLKCTAHFDNSENNPANPDPTDTVKFGPQTWHEMMIGWYATLAVEDDGYG
ncbi:MAG: redoxin domain-containing protein, partial [Pirellulales bacterium]